MLASRLYFINSKLVRPLLFCVLCAYPHAGSVRMLPPTQRANIEEIQIDNLTMKAIDLGGHAVVRHLWEEYLLDASAIIFIVDAADVARFDEAKEELDDLLALEAFVDKPFLILANKQDLDGAVGKNDIMERLGLAGCAHDVITAQRPINVFSVSLVNGSGELESALQWLCQAVL